MYRVLRACAMSMHHAHGSLLITDARVRGYDTVCIIIQLQKGFKGNREHPAW
jgi:hypothetical protein